MRGLTVYGIVADYASRPPGRSARRLARPVREWRNDQVDGIRLVCDENLETRGLTRRLQVVAVLAGSSKGIDDIAPSAKKRYGKSAVRAYRILGHIGPSGKFRILDVKKPERNGLPSPQTTEASTFCAINGESSLRFARSTVLPSST